MTSKIKLSLFAGCVKLEHIQGGGIRVPCTSCFIVPPMCTCRKCCPCIYNTEAYFMSLKDIAFLETDVGVKSVWLYAALFSVFVLVATPIAAGVCDLPVCHQVGGNESQILQASAILAVTFLAVFFCKKQRTLSIGVVPGGADTGAGASNPLGVSPFWIRMPITESMDDLMPMIRALQAESEQRHTASEYQAMNSVASSVAGCLQATSQEEGLRGPPAALVCGLWRCGGGECVK
eukprot:COSAG04_NODE_864_length_9792_cov_22.506035_13_plen_234_part_00